LRPIKWSDLYAIMPKAKNHTFAIERVADDVFLGLFGLMVGAVKYRIAEVWYKVHSDHWRNGYATESLKAVIRYGFETLQLHRIEAGCAVENLGSIRVLEKA